MGRIEEKARKVDNHINVVVIGGMHHNTLGVIRSLGEKNIPKSNIRVLIIDENAKRINIISTSKYITKKNIAYVDSDERIVSWLKENMIEDCKPIVICCSDGSAEEVMSHYDDLCKWYKLPSIAVDVAAYISKDRQSELAADCGLKVPYSVYANTKNKIDWTNFPCIIKPLKNTNGAGKGDIKIANNKYEFQKAISCIKSERILIQEYVEKKMEYQLIGCSINGGSRIIIPGYTDIIRQPQNTNTGYLVYSPITDFKYNRDAVEMFIQKLGYSGLFSMEFIRDKNNDDYFLEINLRNDGNAYCVQSAGINLPYIWCYYQVFGQLPICNLQFKEPIWFIPDLQDIRRGIQSVGVLEWIKEFFCAKSHAVYNLHDIKPIIVQVFEMQLLVFRKIFEKIWVKERDNNIHTE